MYVKSENICFEKRAMFFLDILLVVIRFLWDVGTQGRPGQQCMQISPGRGYSHELVRNPNLAGLVMISWFQATDIFDDEVRLCWPRLSSVLSKIDLLQTIYISSLYGLFPR